MVIPSNELMIDNNVHLMFLKLTAHILDNSGFVFPSNENKVNRDSSSNDAKANSYKRNEQ